MMFNDLQTGCKASNMRCIHLNPSQNVKELGNKPLYSQRCQNFCTGSH